MNVNALHPDFNVTRQPVISAAPKQSPFVAPPSLGVYQHNNVQINDFARLLDSMKISSTLSNTDRQDQSSITFSQQSHKQQDLLTGANHSFAPLRNQSPYVAYDQAPPQVHSSMTNLPSQHLRSFVKHNGVGLGIASAPSLQDSRAASATQTFNQAQDQTQVQSTQFQAMDSSSELIQALQAAVAAQDGAFGQFNTVLNPNGHALGGNVKATPEMYWPGLNNMGVSLRGGLPVQRGNYPGISGDFTSSVGSVLRRTPSGSLHAAGIKISPPADSNTGSGSMTNKGVPYLLPALSPSSPQASSEESSPLTPTFQQLPHSFNGAQTNEA